jgi:hypothetical protein
MYKIDIKDEYNEYNIDDILKRYKRYLDKDLLELLKKLKNTKPEIITDEERELILNNYRFYDGLQDSLGDLFDSIEVKEQEEDEED